MTYMFKIFNRKDRKDLRKVHKEKGKWPSMPYMV